LNPDTELWFSYSGRTLIIASSCDLVVYHHNVL